MLRAVSTALPLIIPRALISGLTSPQDEGSPGPGSPGLLSNGALPGDVNDSSQAIIFNEFHFPSGYVGGLTHRKGGPTDIPVNEPAPIGWHPLLPLLAFPKETYACLLMEEQ